MITNQAYALKSVFGDDMTSEIKSYMVHPIKESRELMDNELYNHIWSNIYEKFKTESLNRMKKLQKNKARTNDYDMAMDIDEEIADIHYNIDTINENELMEYNPRINKEELLYKLEKRKEFKYWKKGNNTSYMYWMPNPSCGLGMIH